MEYYQPGARLWMIIFRPVGTTTFWKAMVFHEPSADRLPPHRSRLLTIKATVEQGQYHKQLWTLHEAATQLILALPHINPEDIVWINPPGIIQ